MPPTRAEIARELGFRSANAAEEHLRALARKGVIALVPGTSRGIQLKDTIREQLGLPLIGRVAAGKPILAEENYLLQVQAGPYQTNSSLRFGLRANSWSRHFVHTLPRRQSKKQS
jgi:repressor LexA